MDLALVVLAIVVALVAFDAIGWLPRPATLASRSTPRDGERSGVDRHPDATAKKIVVDLTGRDID
jgi:hypothetical protein